MNAAHPPTSAPSNEPSTGFGMAVATQPARAPMLTPSTQAVNTATIFTWVCAGEGLSSNQKLATTTGRPIAPRKPPTRVLVRNDLPRGVMLHSPFEKKQG